MQGFTHCHVCVTYTYTVFMNTYCKNTVFKDGFQSGDSSRTLHIDSKLALWISLRIPKKSVVLDFRDYL